MNKDDDRKKIKIRVWFQDVHEGRPENRLKAYGGKDNRHK